jgi:hypothetical protein
LVKIGRAIETELRAEIKDATPPAVPAAEMVLGIDGCFVKGISRNRKTSLEIVLGQIEVPASTAPGSAPPSHSPEADK